MENDLICNFKKCRKRLISIAWVTSCSHIFCDEDGSREFRKSYNCPACDTSLTGKFDIVRVDLQPSEQFKSMVITGLKPETVMEVCSRALAFWSYQSQQERVYQDFLISRAKERNVQLEQYYEEIIARSQTELNSLKTQLDSKKKEFEELKTKYNSISDKMLERQRHYQKLQTMYDSLRRKCIPTPRIDQQSQMMTSSKTKTQYDLPITTCADFLNRSAVGNFRERQSPPQRDFILTPTIVKSTPALAFFNQEVDVDHLEAAVLQTRFNIDVDNKQRPSSRQSTKAQ